MTAAQQISAARQASLEGRHQDAWRIYKTLAAAHPNELMLQYSASGAALSAGDASEAARMLRRFLAVRPDNCLAWGLYGEALVKLLDYAAAAKAFSRAVALGGGPFVFQARLAGLHAILGSQAADISFLHAAAALHSDLATDKFDEALEKEELIFKYAIRTIEDEDHIETRLSHWRAAMTSAGERAAAALPPPPSAYAGHVPVVGFFLHAASTLGHVELALDYMSAMSTDSDARIRVHLYVFTGFDAALLEDCRRRAIPVTFVERESGLGRAYQPYKRLIWLRARAAQDGIAAMVWISVQSLVHFAAAFRVAPLNVFWALRFRGVSSPHIRGYVACASCFEKEDTVHGRRWDLIPLAFRDLRGSAQPAAAAALRQKLGNPKLLFGTFARREKMQGDAWLKAVARSLKSCPNALFVWAGREQDPKVAGMFEKLGVARQTRFVGWVDTRLYAQAIDVFLDCAPVGCGMTAMEAMAWGKPLVSFKDPLTNWGQCLAPLLDGRATDATARGDVERMFALGSGRELLAWADDGAGYAEWVKRLAEDEVLRFDVGAAGRTFTDKYFGDPGYAAGRFARLLRGWMAAC